MAGTVKAPPPQIPLGSSVPALTNHAISVSLPQWDDNIAYEEGDPRVTSRMVTGYPRFFIHRSIQKLQSLLLSKFGHEGEACMLFPSPRVASEARDFLASRQPPVSSRTVEYVVTPGAKSLPSARTSDIDCIELQILFFDKSDFPSAKQFWQHTGDGITSRQAERALAFLGEAPAGAAAPAASQTVKPVTGRNRHYARDSRYSSTPATPTTPTTPTTDSVEGGEPISVPEEVAAADLGTYLEERYGRNLPLFNAPLAKQALRRRIAGGLLPNDAEFDQGSESHIARGVTPDDVYLYPGGMSAIWHAHDIARRARRASGAPEGISACFGFPYTDTLKILSKWGPGCEFFGIGDAAELDKLEQLLDSIAEKKEAPLLALFCEFPSNPLVRSPDLKKLRQLADKYHFLIVVDETIGNFINVDVMPYADVVVSSLTKIFSGDSNVMGGSLVLNPRSAAYSALKKVMDEVYEDNYWPEDAVYMERNSRDYRGRIARVNDNAYAITDYLHSRSLASGPGDDKVIKKVYYPRWETAENYAACQRFPTAGKGGFGGLFSVTFTHEEASKAFYNSLPCAKGPSLGTSFTLASPYTILAHYTELEWAATFGVEPDLVRISVGQEDVQTLKAWFETSVRAAEEAVRAKKGGA